MDLSSGSIGDDVPSLAETVWDYVSLGIAYAISFLSQLWTFTSLNIHRITRFDIASLKFVRDLLESLIVYLYLIVCAFCVSARDCLEVIYEYFSENSSVCVESALLMSSMYLVVGVFSFVYYTQFGALTLTRSTSEERKRVLIAIAHPVDEVLFFGPSILKLKDSCDVKILCFGSGKLSSLIPHFP